MLVRLYDWQWYTVVFLLLLIVCILHRQSTQVGYISASLSEEGSAKIGAARQSLFEGFGFQSIGWKRNVIRVCGRAVLGR